MFAGIRRQNELSFATASLLLSYGLFSGLAYFVFRLPEIPRSYLFLGVGVAALVFGVWVLFRGRRITLWGAATLIVSTAVAMLVLTANTKLEIRAINYGVYVYPLFVYLVWFLPRWLARTIGLTWLAVYATIVLLRYGVEGVPLLFTVAFSSVGIAELLAWFRDRLQRATLTDPLCKVWNRRGFMVFAEKALRASQRTNRPLAILFLDLDGFKAINDQNGHAAGDEVLQKFALALEQAVRPEDTLARVGGDEFAILLPNTNEEQALRIGNRLRREVTVCDWSLGVAQIEPGETIHSFMARADELMLAEKASRKTRR